MKGRGMIGAIVAAMAAGTVDTDMMVTHSAPPRRRSMGLFSGNQDGRKRGAFTMYGRKVRPIRRRKSGSLPVEQG